MNSLEGEYGRRAPEIPSSVSSIIVELAPELGITVRLDPEYGRAGQLTTPDGRKYYFRGTIFDLNTLGASEVARDKDYASHFMQDLGYPVPEGRAFYSDRTCKRLGSGLNKNAAFLYAKQLGFPVIVKPNSSSQGHGVQKVYEEEGFFDAVSVVFNEVKDRVVLVQKPVEGDDYRILVLDDEVIAAYRRTPLAVTGDGKSTILDLLVKKQEQFGADGRDTKIKLGDRRIRAKLSSEHLNFASVLGFGQDVSLLDNANPSSGGDAEDVTNVLDDTLKKTAIQLTADMGLRFCGVDVMTCDPIGQAIRDFTVIEINSAPGVDYYGKIGIQQEQIVKNLYKKILSALVRQSTRRMV